MTDLLGTEINETPSRRLTAWATAARGCRTGRAGTGSSKDGGLAGDGDGRDSIAEADGLGDGGVRS
jgi:hypothetical protein